MGFNTSKKLLRSHFFRNFAMVMSGTAFSQIITVAMSPVLSRLYIPAELGVSSVYASVVGIVGCIATMQFDRALMLPKTTEDASQLLASALSCVLAISGLAGLACLLFPGWIIRMTKSPPELTRWIWMIPVSVFMAGAYQSLNSWSTRRKMFHRSSISQVVRAVAVTTSQTAGGISRVGPMGLIGGSVFGDACAAVALGWQVAKDDMAFLRRTVRFKEMKRLMTEYHEFPMYSGTASLMNTISQSVPVLLLVHYFEPAVVGLYATAMRVLQLPMNLILTSLRQVLFQKATEVYNQQGDTYGLFKKVTLGLMAIAIIPMLIVILFAPSGFSFVLGKKWYTAGVYAQWLILWLGLMFANVPAVLFGQIYRQQRNLLFQDAALLVCRVGAIVFGGMYLSALHTVILYSAVGVAFNAYIILWMWRFLRRRSVSETLEVNKIISDKSK